MIGSDGATGAVPGIAAPADVVAAEGRHFGRPWSTPRERRLAELSVLLVAVLWGANFVVVKAAIGALPPIGFNLLRFALASVTLMALLRWREGSISMPRGDALRLVGLGVLGYGVYQLLWVGGLTAIPAGDSALLVAATPVLTAVLAGMVGADRLTAPILLGAVVSFAGVAIVVGEGVGLNLGAAVADPRVLTGDLLTLAAAGLWAVYTVLAAAILRRYSPLRTIAWAVTSGTLVLLPVGLAQIAESGFRLAPDVVGGIVYSGLISTSLANVLVFRGVQMVGPTRVTAFQFLIPAFAVLFAGLFLAEPVRPGQVLGGAVIVAGILVARRGSLERLRRLSSAQ